MQCSDGVLQRYRCLLVSTLAAEMSGIDVPAPREEVSLFNISSLCQQRKSNKLRRGQSGGLSHSEAAAVVVHVCVKEKEIIFCSGNTAYEYFHTLFT